MKSRLDFPNVNPKTALGLKPNGKPYKAMVVEDKEFHRKQIVQILESEKFEVIATAADGEQALKRYDNYANELDLITTNLNMPRLDGYALLFNLTDRNAKVKIVFISDETSKGVVQDLIKMGAADFILKPIQRVRILDRIRMVMERSE